MTKTSTNYLIIATSALLMQWHSVQFWIDHVGYSGIGWSLMLEAVVIWYWWNSRVILALVASSLLLFGPIYEITKPALENIRSQDQIGRLNQIDIIEIKRLEQSLKTYEKNSDKRIGWSGRIDRIQRLINENGERVRSRTAINSRFDLSISTGIALAQMLALLIIMTAQALAISDQRIKFESKSKSDKSKSDSAKFRRKVIEKPTIRNGNSKRKPTLQAVSSVEIIEIEKIKRIPGALKTELIKQGINQAQWCEKNKISPKNLSFAKTHAQRIAERKETTPPAELLRICQYLGVIDSVN